VERYLRQEWLPVVSISKRGRPLAPTTRRNYPEKVGQICASIESGDHVD
jgi:hypothetical protein